MNIVSGLVFIGKVTQGAMTANIEWGFTAVDFDNTFSFYQIITDDYDNQLENSSGQGTYQANDSTATLNFEDDETNFVGTIDLTSGLFTGNATQKIGLMTGTFNMSAI